MNELAHHRQPASSAEPPGLYQRCPRHDCTLQLQRCSPQIERVLRILNLYELLTVPEAGPSANGDGDVSDLQPSAPEMESGVAAID